jgi:hypothetical protein
VSSTTLEVEAAPLVMAATRWRTNAELVEACARLGYLRKTDVVLDATYGRGVFWRRWRPDTLICHDLKLDGVDFRRLPEATSSVDVVVLDGPYKLNGTDAGEGERYGVDVSARWQDRHALICAGITEAARVVRPEGWLLVKCQDQVCSGAVRWQTHEFTRHAEGLGFTLVDSLLMLGGRAQPPGRSQVHARRNYSTLLVLRAPTWRTSEIDGQASLLEAVS